MALGQTQDFTLPDSISLPPKLQQKLNDTDIEQVKNQYLDQFKRKCEKNGHPEAFEKIQVSVVWQLILLLPVVSLGEINNPLHK